MEKRAEIHGSLTRSASFGFRTLCTIAEAPVAHLFRIGDRNRGIYPCPDAPQDIRPRRSCGLNEKV